MFSFTVLWIPGGTWGLYHTYRCVCVGGWLFLLWLYRVKCRSSGFVYINYLSAPNMQIIKLKNKHWLLHIAFYSVQKKKSIGQLGSCPVWVNCFVCSFICGFHCSDECYCCLGNISNIEKKPWYLILILHFDFKSGGFNT